MKQSFIVFIEVLRKYLEDKEFKVFRASEHQYQLGRSVTQKDVSDFEEDILLICDIED